MRPDAMPCALQAAPTAAGERAEDWDHEEERADDDLDQVRASHSLSGRGCQGQAVAVMEHGQHLHWIQACHDVLL